MRNKNAKRQHFVAPFTGAEAAPAMAEFLPLAKFITDITDGSDDQTDEFADYAGDGTVQTEITGIQESWDISGTFDVTDPAQALIAGMKRKVGNERKVWHMIIDSNGTEEVVGVATALSIVAGSGSAEDHEEFACTLQFDQRPEVRSI
ncbi:MAG: phage tail protein [Turicibacter sp.]|nr:phage tail protein [Turicibacter sp.]